MLDARAAATPDHLGAGEAAGAFARALLGGDAAAASHFSASARLLTPDGTELNSRRSIAALLGQYLHPRSAAGDQERPHPRRRPGRPLHPVLDAQLDQQPRERFQTAGTARLVLAREERRWQIVIAAPWG